MQRRDPRAGTPVRPARRVVRAARSSAGRCVQVASVPPAPAPPLSDMPAHQALRPGPCEASREAAALGSWPRGDRGPAGGLLLLPRAVDARESTPQARVASGSPPARVPLATRLTGLLWWKAFRGTPLRGYEREAYGFLSPAGPRCPGEHASEPGGVWRGPGSDTLMPPAARPTMLA
jgi:hypothetical protein